MKNHRFAVFAWGLLVFTLFVILWGAFVRATGSGAGCGSHWPSCQGAVIPPNRTTAAIIEFTHRLSSGLMGLGALTLFVWAWRLVPRSRAVRWSATLAAVFTVTEGLVGAWLVLAELTAQNSSALRAGAISIHLINTLLLVASLALTAWWASVGSPEKGERPRSLGWGWFAIAAVGMAFLGMTGAVTALGDTLFPAASLAEGLRQDISPTAHFLIRLRVIHPVMAVVVGGYLAGLGLALRGKNARGIEKNLATIQVAGVGVQLLLGVVNVLLFAPVAIQLIHLLVTDLIWVNLVLLSAVSLAPGTPTISPLQVGAAG